MQLLFLSFLVFLLAMTGMAVGVLAGRRALRGSCGGLNLPDGSRIDCGGCARPARDCPRRSRHSDHVQHGDVQ